MGKDLLGKGLKSPASCVAVDVELDHVWVQDAYPIPIHWHSGRWVLAGRQVQEELGQVEQVLELVLEQEE